MTPARRSPARGVALLTCVAVIIAVLAPIGCGEHGAPGAPPAAPAGPPRPARYGPFIRTENLPPALQFVRLGDSTMADVRAHLATLPCVVTLAPPTGPQDLSVLLVQPQGASPTIVGAINSLAFGFASLPNRPAPVLVRIVVTETEAGHERLCRPTARLMGEGRDRPCPAGAQLEHGDRGFGFCAGDASGQLQAWTSCREWSALTIAVAPESAAPDLPSPLVPQPPGATYPVRESTPTPAPAVAAPPPAAPPSAGSLLTADSSLAAPTPESVLGAGGAPAGTVPTGEPGLTVASDGSVTCLSGEHTLRGVTITTHGPLNGLTVGSTTGCHLTLEHCTIRATQSAIGMNSGSLTIDDCILESSRAPGIFMVGGGVTIRRSRVRGRDGAVFVSNGTFEAQQTIFVGGVSGTVQDRGGNAGLSH